MKKEYVEQCPECKGRGFIKVYHGATCNYTSFPCDLCNSAGEITWIDIVKKGKKLPDGVYRRFISSRYGLINVFYKLNGKWNMKVE